MAIPFANEIVSRIPPAATRLRRDIGQLLALVRAHALLHRAGRNADTRGRVTATLDDYAAVRDLVAGVISSGVEKTVKPEVREVVERVAARDGEPVTQAQLAAELGLDKSAVSRRVRAALRAGYLENREEKRGRPHKLVIGDPLPEDQEILPTVDELREVLRNSCNSEIPDDNGDRGGVLRGCTVDRGDTTPPSPHGRADDDGWRAQLLREMGVEP